MNPKQHAELQSYWDIQKKLLDVMYLLANESMYTKEHAQDDLMNILILVYDREKEAMQALAQAHKASVSNIIS
ncbi:hypothetical protein ACFQ3J_08915 [Paenibacillus provencensis]|uniref:Uncharacterized protein n=1 Tax=Paenibacillus provencensis TaxID=441151 RepID=A0ABW3PS10_9BACL|nr:hypothetical protein [Paenibacillus sp. MER 78]MCM3128988.1 hypothetical protein [Paenibacillus sp. MER 78]